MPREVDAHERAGVRRVVRRVQQLAVAQVRDAREARADTQRVRQRQRRVAAAGRGARRQRGGGLRASLVVASQLCCTAARSARSMTTSRAMAAGWSRRCSTGRKGVSGSQSTRLACSVASAFTRSRGPTTSSASAGQQSMQCRAHSWRPGASQNMPYVRCSWKYGSPPCISFLCSTTSSSASTSPAGTTMPPSLPDADSVGFG